jgi:formyltetrahydrofolate hydrolase
MIENNIEQPSEIIDEELIPVKNNQEANDGSTLGKFKDTKTLLDAYNSLEAEFTKKCQKLADLQRELQNNAIFNNSQTLDDVLKDATDKDKYKKEITEILANNLEISNLPNKYQVAFNIIQESNRRAVENLNNQEFLENYVLSNKEINQTIISKYLSNLNNISSLPKIISGSASNVYFTPKDNAPKTLKEAGEVFSKMLK